MSEIDGYVRIQTTNDTAPAQQSTEQLGDAISDSLDTTPADNMDRAINGIGDSAVTTGNLLKANLLSDMIMQGLSQVANAIKNISEAAITSAMDNETAFAKVKTLLTGDDYEQYYNGLMEISNRTGVVFADLAESMYSALSASVAQDKVLDFVEGSINLAKGGFTQTATAIDIVTTALNAYQLSADQATHVQDVLITTQNKGKTTVDELASNMGKLIPTAKGLNVEIEQLGAMYATVTANGVATAETTTYLNTMLNELGAAGSTAEKNLLAATQGTELQGKKFKELSEMGYDVTDVLQLISDYAEKAGLSLSDMFSSSEAGKAANILAGNVTVFKNNMDEMANSADATAIAAETMANTTAEAVNIAKNQINNMVTDIANSVIPIIAETAQQISAAFNENKDDIKEVTSSIGQLIGGGTLTFLIKNIKLITSAIAGATAGVVAFKAAGVITKVIASWQTAALQIALFTGAQGAAALKTAALSGQLTIQEVILATLSGKLDVATAKQAALNAVQAMSPAGAIAIAVGLLATALTGYALCADNAMNKANELSDKTEQLKKNIDDTVSSNEAEMILLKKKSERYEELRTSIGLTSDEQAELKGLAADLQNTFGDEISVVDTLTGKYNDLTTAVENYINSTRMEVKVSALKSKATEAEGNIYDAENEQKFYKDKLDEFSENYGFDWKTFDYNRNYSMEFGKEREAAFQTVAGLYIKQYKEYADIITENQKIVDDFMELATQEYIDTYKSNGTQSLSGEASLAAREAAKANADATVKTYEELRDDIKYQYDMGEIDAATYYTKLAVLRDRYLEKDSKEWRSVNVEIKKYYDKLSEEQQKAYDEQVKAAEEAARAKTKAAEEAARAKIETFNEEKANLQFRLRTNRISEKEYYTELDKLRTKYLTKNTAEWRSAYLESYEYNQKIIADNKATIKQMLSDIGDETKSALENIAAARNSLTQKLTDFNKTFEKITEKVPETITVNGVYKVTTAEHEVETYKMGADSIEDNIKVLEQYGDMLDALKARGADDETMSNILAMDIEEAMKFGSSMLALTDEEWQSYFDKMAQLRKTAADISAKYYQSEVDAVKSNFIDKLRDALSGLGVDMYSAGMTAVMNFMRGCSDAIDADGLNINGILKMFSTGTMETAPTAAKQMSTASDPYTDISKLLQNAFASFDIYIGTTKLADIMVELFNGKIIQNGKTITKN